jgi:hypothetical protein
MTDNNSKRMIIKLTEDGRKYLLFNDGSIEDEITGKALDSENDKDLIDKIMDRFKHGFSDDV